MTGRSPRGIDRVLCAVLGFGTAWTTATQLRVGGIVGLGEVVLALWVVAALVPTIVGARAGHRTPLRAAFLMFWAIAFVALCAGWCAAIWAGVWVPGTERDAFALLLSAVVTLAFLSQPALAGRAPVVVVSYVVALVGPVLVMLALTLAGRPTIGPVNALYERYRFTAWSTNPNQLALACVALPFLTLRLFATARGANRYVLWVCLVGVAVIGLATLSDALVVAWAVGGTALAVRWWVGLVQTRRGLGRKAFACLGVPLLTLAVGVAAGPSIAEFLDDRAVSGYDEGGQGSDRLSRWAHGFEAVATSPVVGLGPGSYSGPTAAFRGEEAHNSVVDWGMSAGVLGVISYLALLGVVTWSCAEAHDALGLIGAASLFVFTMFHYALRQPVYWMQLALLAAPHAGVLARPRARPARRWRPAGGEA